MIVCTQAPICSNQLVLSATKTIAGKSDYFATGLLATSSIDTIVPSFFFPAQYRRRQSFSSIPAGFTVLTSLSEVTASAASCKIPAVKSEADKQLSGCSAT